MRSSNSFKRPIDPGMAASRLISFSALTFTSAGIPIRSLATSISLMFRLTRMASRASILTTGYTGFLFAQGLARGAVLAEHQGRLRVIVGDPPPVRTA